jgi:hypothetical protein
MEKYIPMMFKDKITAHNNGSYFIRVSEVLQVQFPLASFVSGDKDALRNPLRNIAANVQVALRNLRHINYLIKYL